MRLDGGIKPGGVICDANEVMVYGQMIPDSREQHVDIMRTERRTPFHAQDTGFARGFRHQVSIRLVAATARLQVCGEKMRFLHL